MFFSEHPSLSGPKEPTLHASSQTSPPFKNIALKKMIFNENPCSISSNYISSPFPVIQALLQNTLKSFLSTSRSSSRSQYIKFLKPHPLGKNFYNLPPPLHLFHKPLKMIGCINIRPYFLRIFEITGKIALYLLASFSLFQDTAAHFCGSYYKFCVGNLCFVE